MLQHRLPRVVAVALLSCADKLHLHTVVFHLCRPEIAKHAHVRPPSQDLPQFLGYGYAATYHHHVDVVGRAFQKDVAYIAAPDVAIYAQTVGGFWDMVKNVFVELGQAP